MPAQTNGNGTRTLVIVGAVVALTGLATAAVIALSVVNVGPNTTPAIATIIGLVTPTIVALLALLGTHRVSQAANGTSQRVDHVEEETRVQSSLLKEIAGRVERGEL